MSSLFLSSFFFYVGCGTPPAPKPIYPALSEIPPIQEYTNDGQSWNTDAVCWVGTTDDAKWKWHLPSSSQSSIQWIRRNTSVTIRQLIREELKREGYEVKVFDDEYITRQKRLMVNKLILFEAFGINKTIIKEGVCYDMKLNVKVVDNPDQNQSTQCEIWGRSLISRDETKKWIDILSDCVRNMAKAPEFRDALELNPAILQDVSEL
jgi:hypothetical protein